MVGGWEVCGRWWGVAWNMPSISLSDSPSSLSLSFMSAHPCESSVPGASNSPPFVYAYLLRLSSRPYLVCANKKKGRLSQSLRLRLSLGLSACVSVWACEWVCQKA